MSLTSGIWVKKGDGLYLNVNTSQIIDVSGPIVVEPEPPVEPEVPTNPGTRDAMLWPFPSDDPFNLPMATSATFESASSTITASFLSETSSGNRGFYWNQNSSSHPIYWASTSDPRPSIVDKNDSNRSISAGQVYIPLEAVQADPTNSSHDNHCHVIQPDRKTVVEMIGFNWRTKPTIVDVTRVHRVNQYDYSIRKYDMFGKVGNGVRAWGGGTLAGLIRKHECKAAADYINGVTNNPRGLIPHAIALACRADQLYWRENNDGGGNYGWYTGGTTNSTDQPGWIEGRSKAGFMRSLGYRWLAFNHDYQAKTSYTGAGRVPMGALFGIDPNLDINATFSDSSKKGRAQRVIAWTIRDYGARILDLAGVTVGYCEQGADSTLRNELVGGTSYSGTPWREIKNHMRFVTNDNEWSPSGGDMNATRRMPLAPELK